jgi:hypothetical protein
VRVRVPIHAERVVQNGQTRAGTTGAIVVTNPLSSSGRSQTRGRHRKQTAHRKESAGQRVSAKNLLAVAGIATLLAALVVLTGAMAKWATKDSVPVAGARQPPSPTSTTPSDAPPAGQPAVPFATDESGFINSDARCEGMRPALAIGRTPGSLVVICAEHNGQYEYRGVRLSDAAVLRTTAQTGSARGFLAQNASVVYAVSPTELVVTDGDTVIKVEPMIEYRELPR